MESRFPNSRSRGPNIVRKTRVTWGPEVIGFVETYALEYPCFYIEELQQALKTKFPELRSCSASSICRVLHFHLNLTRKVLEKRARESSAYEIEMYYRRLQPFFNHPSQLVFVDETAKEGSRCYATLRMVSSWHACHRQPPVQTRPAPLRLSRI